MFTPDTLIVMASGASCPIGSVRSGNLVKSSRGAPVNVLDVINETVNGLISININGTHPMRATPDQVFLTDRGAIAASMLVPGDRIESGMDSDGHTHFLEVSSVEHVTYYGPVVTLVVGRDGTFLANDVCVRRERPESEPHRAREPGWYP